MVINKKGWLWIVEACFGILIIMGIILIIYNKNYKREPDINSELNRILEEIVLNNSLRGKIFDNLENDESIKEIVEKRIESIYDWKIKICNSDSSCALENSDNCFGKEEIFSSERIVAPPLETLKSENLKKIKIYVCKK